MLALLPATAAAVLLGSCAPRGRADADADATRGAPLRGFAHLVASESTTTLASGDVLRETWHWEPNARSLRAAGTDGVPGGTGWREEQVFLADPASGEVRVRGSNSYRAGTFEGTVAFGEGTSEARSTLA